MIPHAWERKIRSWIQAAAARWHIVAASGDKQDYQLGDEDEDGNSWQDPARYYQHYGFRSRPGAQVEAISVPGRAASSQRVIIATRDPGSMPTSELADWEADLYVKAGSRIWLDKDGHVHIDAAAGKDVIANGGAAKVARQGDVVGWLVIVAGAASGVPVVINAYFTTTNPSLPPPPTPLVPGTSYATPITIGGPCAERFKG